MIRIGVDIGGTYVRVGFVTTKRNGRCAVVSRSASRIPKRERGSVRVCDVVGTAVGLIRRGARQLESAGWKVGKSIGVSAPGAYKSDGRVYPGTVPNIPGLSRIRLADALSRRLGSGWKVNRSNLLNDGVVQGLVAARCYAEFVPESRNGKVVVLVPGTGFGAGVYTVKDSVVAPSPGPQQLFDVKVRAAQKGEPILVEAKTGLHVVRARGGEPLIMENLATGKALESLGTARFGRTMTGEKLSELAMKGNKVAREIFKQIGSDLARFIIKLSNGGYEKLVVRYKPDTKGTEVFLVGGWLQREAAKSISLRTARKFLNIHNHRHIKIVLISDIPDMRTYYRDLGVIGASMLLETSSSLTTS